MHTQTVNKYLAGKQIKRRANLSEKHLSEILDFIRFRCLSARFVFGFLMSRYRQAGCGELIF